jgi:hypothetical protein
VYEVLINDIDLGVEGFGTLEAFYGG